MVVGGKRSPHTHREGAKKKSLVFIVAIENNHTLSRSNVSVLSVGAGKRLIGVFGRGAAADFFDAR